MTRPVAASRMAAAAAAGGATALVHGAVRRRPPGGPERWRRSNFRGRDVDLLGGPVATAGALAAAVVAGRAGRTGAVVAVLGAAGLGLYDDLYGDRHARGLRGHLEALRAGRVTTGVVKMAGLTAAGAASALVARAAPLDVLVDAAVVAGSANLLNLLDLRPGRALKAAALVGTGLLGRRGPCGAAAAGAVTTAVLLLPADLHERRMLGDCGANAIGGLLGWALTARAARGSRLLALSAIAGLTLASERVSFTSVIERTPALSALDRWGRLPG